MNNFKLKILNNYGKSGKSTNDWNVPTITVFFFFLMVNEAVSQQHTELFSKKAEFKL